MSGATVCSCLSHFNLIFCYTTSKANILAKGSKIRSGLSIIFSRQRLCWRCKDTDPFREGILIYGLTTLNWKNLSNATAEPCSGPSGIVNYYDRGIKSPEWNSSDVEEMFVKASTNATNATSPSLTSPSPPFTTPEVSHIRLLVGRLVGGTAGLERPQPHLTPRNRKDIKEGAIITIAVTL